jgi:hypothetical protein
MNYKERVEAGLCGKCGEKVESGSLCPKHREEARKRAAEKRARNRATGKCHNDNRPAVSGGKCQVCIDNAKASRKRVVTKRKAAGLCTECGKPAKDGCTLCQKHIDDRSAVSSRHYARRKEAGLCRFCNRQPAAPSGSLCEYHQGKYQDYRFQLKLEVLDAYGGPTCSAKCGIADPEILEIDHIDGGGRKHFRELGITGGYQFYLWLRREGFPPGFRVLCPTCNKKAYREALKA